MPLTTDSIVHQNSGGVAAATSGAAVTVSLTGGDTTAAGNTLFVILASPFPQGFSITPPSGWENAGGAASALRVYVRGPFQGLAAGESSWNFTPVSATPMPVRWTVLEFEGVASGAASGFIIDALGPITQATSGTTLADTTALTSTYDGLALSFHTSYNTAGTDTWDSQTGGFVELVEGSQNNGGTGNVTLSVSALHVDQLGTYGPTATCSRTLAASPEHGTAYSIVINAAGARHAANLRFMNGAEHGLVTGNTLGSANFKILETVTAGVSVSGTAARSGSYGWLLSSSSAACNFTQFTLTQLSFATRVGWRLALRFPTLPGADLEIKSWTTISGTSIVLRYINTGTKLGLKVGAGTEQVSSAITANQWVGVDLALNFSASTYTADWSVDYNAELSDTTAGVAQTQATGSGSAGSTINTNRTGWTTSSTATVHIDDEVVGDYVHYPFGDVRILPLKVDPAGTPSISGTSTNFGVMTNNGTVAAWNATNARNAVDDVPPDLSGTRDAAVCVLTHATDYAEFPMETYALATNQVNARGVRWDACLWAASATASTIRTNIYDGVTLFTGYTEADPNADATATPAWIGGTVRPASGRVDWTQAKIDALVFRIGSNDGNPDIGIDNVVFSLAVVKAQPEVLFGETGSLYIEAARDPDTQGLVGFTVNIPSDQAVSVDYEVDGVPSSTGSLTTANSPWHGDDQTPHPNQ